MEVYTIVLLPCSTVCALLFSAWMVCPPAAAWRRKPLASVRRSYCKPILFRAVAVARHACARATTYGADHVGLWEGNKVSPARRHLHPRARCRACLCYPAFASSTHPLATA